VSINSMVDVSVVKHLAKQDPKTSNATLPLNLMALTGALDSGTPTPLAIQQAGSKALQGDWDRITTYIPSEVIGAYLAILNIVPGPYATTWDPWAFYVLLALTPIAVVAGVAGKIRSATGKLPPIKAYSIFPILAAPVAFAAWGLAISLVDPRYSLLGATQVPSFVGVGYRWGFPDTR